MNEGMVLVTRNNNNLHKNSLTNNIFTILFILAPLMKVYASPVPGLSGFELIMSAFLVLLLITRVGYISISWKNNATMILLLFLYVNVVTLITALIQRYFSVFAYFSLSLRWLFYIVILLLAKTMLNKKLAIKLLDYVVMLSSLGMFIQVFVYRIFNTILPLKIPGLRLATESISKLDVTVMELKVARMGMFRAYSFYLEPAHFCYVATVGLAALLFISQHNKYTYLKAIIISVAVALSTSSTGVILVAIIWISFLFYNFKKNGMKIKGNYILFLFIVIFFLIFMYDTTVVKYAIDKVITDEGKIVSSARTDGYVKYLNLLDSKEKILGVGFGNMDNYFLKAFGVETKYVSTWGHLILSSGWGSLILFFGIMLYFYIKAKPHTRIFVLMFFLINYSSGSLFGVNLFYYLSWVFVFTDSYITNKGSLMDKQNFKTDKGTSQYNTT